MTKVYESHCKIKDKNLLLDMKITFMIDNEVNVQKSKFEQFFQL
jgi:hypothetical protein